MVLYGQDQKEETLVAFKKLEFEKANQSALEISNISIRNSFLALTQNRLLGNPIVFEPIEDLPIDILRIKDSIIYQLLQADLRRETKSVHDSILSKKYYSLSKKASQISEPILYNDILRKYVLTTIYRNKDTIFLKRRLDEYEESCQNPEDFFWLYYLKTGYLYKVKDILLEKGVLHKDSLKSFRKKEFDLVFQRFKDGATSEVMQAYFYHNYGTYQAAMLQDYAKSIKSFDTALKLYSNHKNYFINQRIKALQYNTAVNYKNLGAYKQALSIFLDDLDRDKERLLLERHYDNIIECYEKLGIADSANIFYRKKDSLVRVGEIIERDKMNREMDNTSREKALKSTISNLYSLIPILLIVFAILVITFYFYKRYKKKSVLLTEEKSETLKRLDQIEEAVTTKYIVLPDKTKVYIGNLIYIKADDHYLWFYRWEDKPLMVRGTLSKVREKLPPNFIQCHRSYIVNNNYVIQAPVKKNLRLKDGTLIPVSRSNLGKFNK